MNPPNLKIGTRVFITGTKHHGFRGKIIERPRTPEYQSLNSIPVLLDEWDEPMKFYFHNLIMPKVLAAGLGIEPRFTLSESVCLPLADPAIQFTIIQMVLLINKIIKSTGLKLPYLIF